VSSSYGPVGPRLAPGRRPAQIERSGRCDWPAGPLLLLLLLLALAGFAGPAAAQETNRAGLVIQFAKDRVETWCLAFEGDEIAGNDLLARSGLDLIIDATSGLGVTVCQIEGQGCAFPAEHCFCQCMGGEGCRYWNYFYREPGAKEWTYSPLGALLRQVQPGSVEAWVWGDGSTPPDQALAFEAICAPATPTAQAPTETPVETPLPTSPPDAGTAPGSSAATATITVAAPSPTAAVGTAGQPPASPTPVTPESAADASSYLVFGLLVLGLLLIGAIVWQRRR